MSKIDLQSVELTTTLRTAPLNGAPSSKDYNALNKEILQDLSELSSFVNDQLLPVLAALPTEAKAGLEGATLYANSYSTDPLFYDGQSPKTVADALAYLSGLVGDLHNVVDDAQGRIKALQTRLATTDQNDLRSSMQSMQDTVRGLSVSLSAITGDLATLTLDKTGTRNLTQQITLASGVSIFEVTFDSPMPLNNVYSVLVTLDGGPGLSVVDYVRKPNGTGLTVRVSNANADAVEVYLNVYAKACGASQGTITPTAG